MSDRISPLADVVAALAAASGPLLTLSDGGPLTQIDLRGPADAFTGALGFTLPGTPGNVARQDDLSALWLGPDEWLLLAPDAQRADLLARLAGGIGRTFATATDVSAARAVLCLDGPGARGVLGTACALDLHPSAFPPGRCAQTQIARVHTILEAREGDGWRILVRPSVADHLALFLADAAETLKSSV